jgi:uncharacterized protein DUF4178
VGTALVIVVILVVIAVAAGVYLRGRRQPGRVAPGATPSALAGSPPPSDVRALKPGDVVNYEGGDYIVEGTLRLDQDGFEWQEHRLVDEGRSLWLSVEDDEGLEVVVWERAAGTQLEPGAGSLTHEGVGYELDERGHAQFTASGSTGTGPSGRMEFVDYEAGERRLSFERFATDAGWEIGVGRVISEHVLDIYPSRT